MQQNEAVFEKEGVLFVWFRWRALFNAELRLWQQRLQCVAQDPSSPVVSTGGSSLLLLLKRLQVIVKHLLGWTILVRGVENQSQESKTIHWSEYASIVVLPEWLDHH